MTARPAARYIVGIDLGTTHTVVAVADTHASAPVVELFPVPQLIAPGEVAARNNLPSFRYHPLPGELSAADLTLGFAAQSAHAWPQGVVGTLAQTLGGRVPGRLIASAKSWLCHAGVDRDAAILPWGSGDDVPKLSPVAASASYLTHVQSAWNAAHPSAPLAEQEIVLTVPASFDEVARALTLEAAKRAGLPQLRLLEEPQAAFYAWLERHREDLESALGGVKLALVLDVGGGTTDLTLIRVELRETGPVLTRLAVGDHLMLGGDNMDRALARLCEPALAGADAHLSPARLSQLVEQCRIAKEQLLGRTPPEQVSVALLGAGSKLIGGQLATTLARNQALNTVLDGFFPDVPLDAKPAARKSALLEFGLPFAADAGITRHVASFLARHRKSAAEALGVALEQAAVEPARAMPDAVLFNGGVFQSPAIEARMLEVLEHWRGRAPVRLDNREPDLAVARGAVAYGLARRGVGLRIGGGSARSYYLRIDDAKGHASGVCILPRGAEEGETYAQPERAFMLRLGRPVQFRLLTSTSEATAVAGALAELNESYQALPDLAAVIEASRAGEQELRVELQAQLTEVGTLELCLVAADDPARRYQLEFQLRGVQAAADAAAPARVTQLHARFGEAVQLMAAFYGKSAKNLEGLKIRTLRADLEKLLGARETWQLPLLRELFGELLAGARRRRRSPEHERLWFNLAGYCLRPGFGYPADAWRVEQLAALYPEGVQAAVDAQVWSQFWIMYRRVAGGLDEAQQTRILDDLAYYLEPPSPRPRQRPKGPRAQGIEDMVRLAGALERVPAARKFEVGNWLLARLAQKELSAAAVYWSLGRLGGRGAWARPAAPA
jgi:molecular chaperone DnaK (HSP70)